MANPSTNTFDAELLQIGHFQSIPTMLPYVGGDYLSASHGKLLLIGESFYFPEESTIHLDAEHWYSLTEDSLNGDELQYIDCRGLLECPWDAAGHAMYREINRCLDEHRLSFEERAISHIAFANAFFRPASKSGESISHCSTALDHGKSREITKAMIRVLKPDLVIYVSKFAWDSNGRFLAEAMPDVSFEFTSHPADPRHWNVASYAHGRSKFMSILEKFFAAGTDAKIV